MSDAKEAPSLPRGKSAGQRRRKAIEKIRGRRDFLLRLVEKRRAAGEPYDHEAEEASALGWALDQIASSGFRSVSDELPPVGEPVMLVCDAGVVTGLRIGGGYLCACGAPEPLSGVTAWALRSTPA